MDDNVTYTSWGRDLQLPNAICCDAQNHFREVTGLPINPYFSAYKFAWLLENVPAVKSAVEDGTARFGTIDTYLIWRLTGVCAVACSQM